MKTLGGSVFSGIAAAYHPQPGRHDSVLLETLFGGVVSREGDMDGRCNERGRIRRPAGATT
jgi:hypothetical protein